MSGTASPAMDRNHPPRWTRGVRHAICAVVVALFASSLPAASAKRGTVKIHDIVDDFSASALSRCEACAAVTHAEILYIDRVKMGKLARTGSSAVGEEIWMRRRFAKSGSWAELDTATNPSMGKIDYTDRD